MSFQPTPLWNPVEVTPPWGWNPAATFLTAYTSMQENKREQQDMQMAAELQRILLPQKKAEVEFNLKKLAYESENLTDAYKLQSELIDARRRILRSGAGSSGSSSTVPGSGNNVVSQDQQPQQQLGYSNRLRKTGAGTLGSGLQPIQPVGGN